MRKNKIKIIIISLVVLGIIVFLLSICFGSVHIPLIEVIKGIFKKSSDHNFNTIINTLRLPRVLGAAFAGSALAVAGLLLQTILNNDLCAPNIIGINSGAGLFVICGLCFFPLAYYMLPLLAFIGALITALVVIYISKKSSKNYTANLILSGVAIGAVATAGISYLSVKYPDVLSSYTAFSVGGFNGLYLKDIIIPIIVIMICFIITYFLSAKFSLFSLGDEMATSLGINVRLYRIIAVALASCLAGAAVAYAGLIGFVGLIVPHISKRIIKGNLQKTFIASIIIGAILVMLADLIARVLFAPGEIPSGIILNIIGAPFFIFLLLRRNHKYD